MEILDRVRLRIPKEEASEDLLLDYIDTISDRLCIRLGVDSLPDVFSSICADAAIKMYRRIYYEGISSEGSANISTSFVEDILAEYNSEISEYKNCQSNKGGSGRTVHFI